MVCIYTVNGQKVFQSDMGQLSSGWHEFAWDGRNDQSIPVSSGIYFYQVIYRTTKGEKWVNQGKMHLSK
jgi:flagellar hook assembly protein FlgD